MIEKIGINYQSLTALAIKINEIIDYLNDTERRQIDYINKLWDTPLSTLNIDHGTIFTYIRGGNQKVNHNSIGETLPQMLESLGRKMKEFDEGEEKEL